MRGRVMGLFVGLIPVTLAAQWDTLSMPFHAITIRDGLSQGLINHIAQDHFGFMWFATKDGLNRYDGYHFDVYRHDAADSTSVADSYITTLHVDRSGRLWVGTLAGLDLFDPITENFIHFPAVSQGKDHAPGIQGTHITAIAEDPEGRIWVSSDHGLDRVTPGRGDLPVPAECAYLKVMSTAELVRADIDRQGRLLGYVRDQLAFTIDTRRDPIRTDTMEFDGVLHVAGDIRKWYSPLKEDRQGGGRGWFDPVMIEDTLRRRTYAVHGHGVMELGEDAGRGHTLFANASLKVFMATPEPALDDHGNIWMPGLAGLWRFDPDARRLTRVVARDPNLADMVNNVKVAYRDRTGLIWIGTSGYGILTYDPRVERFNTHPSPSAGWMAPARDGQVIMNLRRGLTVYDPRTERFSIELDLPDLAARTGFAGELSEMMAAVQDDEGIFWLTFGQLERYDHDAGTLERFMEEVDGEVREFDTYCFPLHLDAGTRLWFGAGNAFRWFDRVTHEQGAIPYPVPVSHNPYLFLQAIHQDPDGVFWLCTISGLLRYDPNREEWRHFTSDPRDTTTLSHHVLFAIEPDPRDPERYLWIGTNGGGLDRFDKSTGSVRRWFVRDGLPNEVVYGILADREGYLWMSTNKGIARFDPATDTFRAFDAADGLQGDEYNRNAFCRTGDGTLFFGGVAGFDHFRPSEIGDEEAKVEVRITDIRLMDRSIAPGGSEGMLRRPPHYGGGLEMPHGPNMLTFEFAAMEFSEPGRHRYEYQLVGFDPDWVRSGTGNTAIYTNLDPGHYRFRVRLAGGPRGSDMPETSFGLVVLPPWWSSWWFYLALIVAVAGGIVLVVRLRTAGLHRQKELLERTVAERTAELNREKEEAELQRRRAEHSGRVKQQFLANMSHEIRTPMNAIMGMTGILRRREHLPAQRRYLDAIAQSSEGLLVIINDILDMSKMEAGKIVLGSVPFDPAAILEGVRNMLLPGAEEKGLRLDVLIGPGVPRRLIGDPARLQQVLMNLTGNAIKFTDRGSVQVRATAEPGRNGRILLRIEVIDTGRGIPATLRDRIFEEFDQGQEATSFKYGGTGLGLSISKRLVEMQGGTIEVASHEGSGSTFTVLLPYTIDASGGAGADNAVLADVEPPLRDLRILLAEDNAFNALVACDELADAIPGAQVEVATNGRMAVDMVRNGRYDLVLMDVQMPEMNGYEATRAIRALDGDAGRIAIIAMTANVLSDERERCADAGMDDHIPKPFNRSELVEAIGRALFNRDQGS